MSGRRLTGTLFISALAAMIGADGSGAILAQALEPAQPRPVGVLCMWAFVNAAAEGGRRCRAGQNPALQAELDRLVARFDAYVLANSSATPADVARFKSEQGSPDRQDFCAIGGGLFDNYARAGVDGVRRDVDNLLARRPAVEWGDCI